VSISEVVLPAAHEIPDSQVVTTLTQAGALQAQLAALQTALVARVLTNGINGQENAGADRLLNVTEAARLLGKSPDWLYRRASTLPFCRRIGRSVRFSAKGVERYIHTHQSR
jgi:predicted DNA-binding transcriptional regulator AlpA